MNITAPSSRKNQKLSLPASDKKKEKPSYMTTVCRRNNHDTYLDSKYYYTEIFKD